MSAIKREDYITIEVTDGIATIWLDRKGEKMNIISPGLIGYFDELVDEIESDDRVEAVVFISRKKDFIAGADINAFKAEKPGDFQPVSRKGHAILNRISRSKKPFVAAIHGTAYGLGVELSLACAGRVASDDRSTKLALPEVKLGLLPGAGGTQRLPRLVGLRAALDIMLTGKNVYGRTALRMGLVDELVHPSKLHTAACALAKKLAAGKFERKRKKSLLDRFLDDTSAGRSIVFNQARKTSAKLTQGNYPAIPWIIDCVETGLKKGMEAGLESEVQGFESLMLGNESRALIYLFHQLTDKKKNPMKELAKPVRSLAMLGAGFMGAGITEVSVTNGIHVILKDIKADMIRQAEKDIWQSLDKRVKRKSLSRFEAERIINNVSGQLTYDNFDKADLVVEAVLERMDLKQKVLAEVEAVAKPDVIFASNTSALPLSLIAQHAKRPENVIGMHYFSPVPKMPLLEIVVTSKTADWVTASCFDVGVRQGKTCIVVKDTPGFYVNRILSPYLNEVMLMIEEGAKIEDVDRAFKKLGFPVGPVALMDEVGIDVGAHVMSGELMEAVKDREGVTVSQGLPKMFEAGWYGRKNGKGYYTYHPKTKKRVGPNPEVYGFFGGKPRIPLDIEEMKDRGLMIMLNEAMLCLEENVIRSVTDGDVGAVFGIGFLPFTGGPFKYVDAVGAADVVARMEKLEKKFGPKFRPAKILKEYAAAGRKFHGS